MQDSERVSPSYHGGPGSVIIARSPSSPRKREQGGRSGADGVVWAGLGCHGQEQGREGEGERMCQSKGERTNDVGLSH